MIWAWIGATVVGVTLGLLGSGSPILTLPMLVYLLGHDEESAIAEWLAIVGGIAVFRVLRAALQRRIDRRQAPRAFPQWLGSTPASAAEDIEHIGREAG
jgi:uncharacterized membrane protein YfcA